MHAINTTHAILVSTLVLQLVLNADGALVEPSITIKLETLHSNAVASRPDSHTLSLAQHSSELLIAVDSTVTGLPISAMLQNQDNSQTRKLATRLALLKLFTRSVMLLRRNVKLVKWELTQDATPELSARPPATNHTLSAIQLQANVDLATQLQTRTAQKLKERAEQSAKSLIPNPNAITAPESAQNAKMDKVVLIPRHAQQLARKYHQTVLTPATGLNSHQHVNKIQREPLARKHVLMNARQQSLVSVTSKVECASSVIKVQVVCKP